MGYDELLYEAYGYSLDESDVEVEAAIRHLLTHKEDIDAWDRVLHVAEHNKKRIRWVSRVAQITRNLVAIDIKNEQITYNTSLLPPRSGYYYATPLEMSFRDIVLVGVRSMEAIDV